MHNTRPLLVRGHHFHCAGQHPLSYLGVYTPRVDPLAGKGSENRYIRFVPTVRARTVTVRLFRTKSYVTNPVDNPSTRSPNRGDSDPFIAAFVRTAKTSLTSPSTCPFCFFFNDFPSRTHLFAYNNMMYMMILCPRILFSSRGGIFFNTK